MLKIGKRTVDRLLKQGRAAVEWDTEDRGFGVRVSAAGPGRPARASYVAKWSMGGQQFWKTLGQHGRGTGLALPEPQTWTPEHARSEARKLLGTRPVGEASRRALLPVKELVAQYIDEAVAKGRAKSTLREYRRQQRQLIEPHTLGRLLACHVTEVDIDAFKGGLRKTPTQANRTLTLLQAAFKWGRVRPNPVADVERYAAGKRRRKRHLADDELQAVGRALRELEADGSLTPVAAGLLRALLLSGARPGELSALKWEQVDLAAGRIMLGRTKTGEADPRSHTGLIITPPLREVLTAVADYREAGNPYVFPGKRHGRHLTDY